MSCWAFIWCNFWYTFAVHSDNQAQRVKVHCNLGAYVATEHCCFPHSSHCRPSKAGACSVRFWDHTVNSDAGKTAHAYISQPRSSSHAAVVLLTTLCWHTHQHHENQKLCKLSHVFQRNHITMPPPLSLKTHHEHPHSKAHYSTLHAPADYILHWFLTLCADRNNCRTQRRWTQSWKGKPITSRKPNAQTCRR